MKKTAVLLLITVLISGFAALSSKPDFAFPAQVSKQAQRDLKSAIKAHNGPATLRALTDYALAETAIEPDSTAAVARQMATLTAKVNDPATRALILLLQAEVTNTAADTVLTYTGVLRTEAVEAWREAIDVDATYLPTLYDFAAERVLSLGFSQADSLYTALLDFHRYDAAPTVYWTLRRGVDWDEAVELLERYADSRPAADYLLQWLSDRCYSRERQRQLYALIHGAAISSSPLTDAIAKRLTVPQISVEAPQVCPLDSAAAVKVSSTNANAASLAVYALKPERKHLRTVSLTFAGSGVFDADTLLYMQLPGYGEYSFVPLLSGRGATADDVNSGAKTVVTSMLIQTERYGSAPATVMALDAVTGTPLQGVSFAETNGRISAAKGADRYTPTAWKGYNTTSASTTPRWAQAANILTDRAIYHPGDTLHYAATVYKYGTASRHQLLENEHVTVQLYNANSKLVSTQELTTDSLGRVAGEFLLPSSGLTGRFRVQISGMGQTFVTVSEYKAPTFETTCQTERLPDGKVRISGSALTYSGFPVIDATVSIDLRKLMPRTWWFNYT